MNEAKILHLIEENYKILQSRYSIFSDISATPIFNYHPSHRCDHSG
jgi:hypothetical protein